MGAMSRILSKFACCSAGQSESESNLSEAVEEDKFAAIDNSQLYRSYPQKIQVCNSEASFIPGTRILKYIPQNPCGKATHKIIQLKFTDTNLWPWGAKIHGDAPIDEWYVLSVTPGDQFHEKGVRCGWKILRVNQVELDERNRKHTYVYFKHGLTCTVTFEVPLPRDHSQIEASRHQQAWA